MALLPKKTYSRRNNELSVLCEKEKENVDPFDELLSSPLKQEVEFQPLSFWGRKIRRIESKEKSKKFDCGLFKSSDSDESNSPCQRKRKPKAKDSRARTLQPKSRSQKLCERRKNYSAACTFSTRTKPGKPILSDETCVSGKEIEKIEGWSLDSTIYWNESMEETLKSSYKCCDTFGFHNVNKNFSKTDSVNHSYSTISNRSNRSTRYKINYEKKLNKYHDEANFINTSRSNFKIFEDINFSREQSGEADKKTLMYNGVEGSINSTIYFDESMDETLVPCQLGNDSFKFVTMERHFNYPYCISANNRSFLESDEFNKSSILLGNNPKMCISPVNWKHKGDSKSEKFDKETSIYFGNSLEKTALNYNEAIKKSLLKEESAFDSEKLKETSVLSGQSENTIFDVSMLDGSDNETLVFCEKSSVNTSLNCYDSMDKTLYNEDSNQPVLNEESKEMSALECQSENTFSDCFNLICLNDTELEELIQELICNANAMDGVVLETSSNSDNTLSSFVDEETVINVKLKSEMRNSPVTDSDSKKNTSHSVSNGVSVLTTSMSELTIKNATSGGSSESEKEKDESAQESIYEDKDKDSFSLDLRNVTTKRRGVLSKRYKKSLHDRLSLISQESPKENAEMELDQSAWLTGRASMDWNKSISFVNPVFESTRVFDIGFGGRKRQTNRFENNESILEETLSGLDRTYNLKPGKKWLRSRSVLKQLQNGTITGGRLESTKITGRKFESFVQEMLEMQNERSGFFNTLADITGSQKTVIDGGLKNARLSGVNATKTILECDELPEKSNDSAFSNENMLEKSSLNHTVKVIQSDKKESAFRSALGLEGNRSLQQEDSAQEESSICARDFILMQCGQEDVLPFEEYFNERTLGNCKKIGEGVYGEVFMCNDTVIKIIPIEGVDKVNGEPQKTFAEIISEVVIASKLSNLRKGKKHRTDGFSEMKRCWCVKGKYPKHLLRLWKEYDEQGSGSENDSPVMFEDDQLYIILELANGGKDLESFVFSSSAQSLSIFIQAAFSLAVAEKTFEFEHRDLHWGNVLILETKDKFMSVYLDGVEYKIPTKGVKVCIIDFTLSRINHEGCCIFNDLSVDPSLFSSEGDYQFEIYRLMLKEVKNDWSLFRPKTNLFWLHYTLDKMLKMVRYRNKKAKVHIKHLKNLKALECVVLEHTDSSDFVLGNYVYDAINKL